MYRKSIAILLTASFLLALSGCGEQNQEAGASGQSVAENRGSNGEGVVENRTAAGAADAGSPVGAGSAGGLRLLTSADTEGCSTEQGYYYLTFDAQELSDGNYATHLMYMDFAAGQEIYLCSNAGCSHDTQDCPSVFLWDDFSSASTLLFVWQDALYILSKYPDNDGSMSFSAFGEEGGESAGMDGSAAVLYRANLDGTGREKVYSFDSSLVLEDLVMGDEECLYLVTKEITAEKEDQNTYFNSTRRRLVSLEPDSGQLLDICSLEFDDTVSWHVRGCYGRTLVLEGTDYGREISNEERFSDDAYKDLYEKSQEVYATLALDDPKPVIRYRQDNKDQNSSVIDGNMLYLSSDGDGVVRSMDLSTGVEQVICSREDVGSLGGYYLYRKIGDKLCCEDGSGDSAFTYIDVNTGEVQRSPLVNKSLGWSLDFRAVLKEDVLVIYDYDATPSGEGAYEINRYQYGLISQEDLFAGNDNFRKINMIGKGE